MTSIDALPAAALCTRCDPATLDFDTTDTLEELKEFAGQDRALAALHFGVDIERDGYNLYVMGPAGMGKHSMVQRYLEQRAAEASPPDDWCYVNNFEQPAKPRLLRLPAGQGNQLRQQIIGLMDDLCSAMPSAFESEQYQAHIGEIRDEVKEKRETAIEELGKEAESHAIQLIQTTSGFSFIPLKGGKMVTPQEYEQLPEAERKRIEEIVAVLQEKLEHVIRQVYQWERQAKQKVRALNREAAMSAVGMLINDLKARYRDIPCICTHLEALQKDVIEHTDDFLNAEGDAQERGLVDIESGPFRRYHVNVLVDNSKQQGLPVLYEDDPSHSRLIGRMEHIAQMGTLITDFGLIKAGALHRANGGFLVLDIAKLLTQPLAWEGLKRALYSHEIKIRSLEQILSLVSTVSLEPEPIPLDVKVVLLGDRTLFYLLLEFDDEFHKLFKVAADFENTVTRTEENQAVYARLIATIVKRENLLPLGRDAVARVIDHSARLAQDAEKLSNHLLSITDLMCEADFLVRKAGRSVATREDIQHAIDAQAKRVDRLRDMIHEEITRGLVLIDTAGSQTGQVNGLSVIDLGNFSFGQPFRITATARLGDGKVVDIEREVELGEAIHSKGVLIVASFLGERYARSQPLSLSASLVFEQSYGKVEGDSASVGELCALLSKLADAPIRQGLAVTGSVNQRGQVQAIGGVNEKIEGFFDVCQQRGLSGQQGVIIPAANVNHLMLKSEVVEAAAAGKFHVYAVDNVDQAIELLTGVAAGTADDQGVYPPDTINQRVQARVEELAKLQHQYEEKGEAEEEEGGK